VIESKSNSQSSSVEVPIYCCIILIM